MKRVFAILCLLSALPAVALAQVRGDVNGDGLVNSADISAVVDVITTGVVNSAADVNGDGRVDSGDISYIVNIITGGNPEETLTGAAYVWDDNVIPEIHIDVSEDQWNQLLSLYDGNSGTKQYIHVRTLTYIKGNDTTIITDPGLRLKGNTSRRRPEGSYGEMHSSGNTDWHHVHLGLNLRKYHKDEDHTISGIRKLYLKWFKDDATYVREVFCYDLMERYNVWTAPQDNYCRLWLHVGDDATETYYGIYGMVEPIDKQFIKRRKGDGGFDSSKGNLWKCRYPASLVDTGADMWYDDDTDDNHTYKLQTNTDSFTVAREQLVDFMLKLKGKGRESFYKWINQITDVDLLLRTYAVNVAVGMWDDYWNNGNNFYIYFSTTDKYDYRFYFIPYDYDNTLGTSLECGVQSDAGRQDPLNWGSSDNPLIKRLLEFDEYRDKYVAYLKELVEAGTGLMHVDEATQRIADWEKLVAPYVNNDTGEDTTIEDKPAYWGNHSEYRVLERGSNNFFKVKAETINKIE